MRDFRILRILNAARWILVAVYWVLTPCGDVVQ